MKRTRKSESGQVLVIMVGGIIAILAFAALALDGGMFYSDRRYTQNVADNSAFTGAGAASETLLANNVNYSTFDCSSAAVAAAQAAAITEAQNWAAANGFTIAGDLSAGHGVTTNCVIDTSGTYDKKYIEVHVMITSIVQTAFAHLFYDGEMRNTLEAITIVEPSEGVGLGLAIVALDESCDNATEGLVISGNAGVDIQFSGAHSNSCIVKNGGVTVNASGGQINYNDYYTDNGTSGSVTPAPTDANGYLIEYSIDPPQCGPKPSPKPPKVQSGGGITPGWYESLRVANNQFLTLAPGLYCIEEDVLILGGSTVRIGTLDGVGAFVPAAAEDGVTIYLESGSFNIGGGVAPSSPVDIHLRAPKKNAPNLGSAIPGMLIFLAYGNTGNIDLLGSAGSSFSGTVYAPDGTVNVGGTTNSINEFGTQIVADDINVVGDAILTISYDPDDIYWGFPYLGLEQ